MHYSRDAGLDPFVLAVADRGISHALKTGRCEKIAKNGIGVWTIDNIATEGRFYLFFGDSWPG